MNIYFTTNELYTICNKYGFFTNGSIGQYNKLFELNNNGADFDELSLIIWVCTTDRTRQEIKDILKTERNIKISRDMERTLWEENAHDED